MLKKIYLELVKIRKELEAIRHFHEPKEEIKRINGKLVRVKN